MGKPLPPRQLPKLVGKLLPSSLTPSSSLSEEGSSFPNSLGSDQGGKGLPKGTLCYTHPCHGKSGRAVHGGGAKAGANACPILHPRGQKAPVGAPEGPTGRSWDGRVGAAVLSECTELGGYLQRNGTLL